VTQNAQDQLNGFLAKFDPHIEARAQEILAAMQRRLPGAVMPVYDNYNALAVAFGASERLRDVVFSIAVYPRWVSLFFSRGVQLDDPEGLLKGSGGKVRHIVLDQGAATLGKPGVEVLIAAALDLADPPIDQTRPGGLIIKSVSAKQRPRRPGG
jgi:hypothetical protein